MPDQLLPAKSTRAGLTAFRNDPCDFFVWSDPRSGQPCGASTPQPIRVGRCQGVLFGKCLNLFSFFSFQLGHSLMQILHHLRYFGLGNHSRLLPPFYPLMKTPRQRRTPTGVSVAEEFPAALARQSLSVLAVGLVPLDAQLQSSNREAPLPLPPTQRNRTAPRATAGRWR